MKAPLIIGADLRSIHQLSLDILMNEELIAANQDPLGEPARCINRKACTGPVQIYTMEKSDGNNIAVITNWDDEEHSDFTF